MKVKSPNRSSWRMFLPMAAVLLLTAAWSAYWLIGMSVARSKSAEHRERLAADGLELICRDESWGGYPFRFDVTCASPRLLAAGAGVTAGSLRVVTQAYNPWHVLVLVDGPTRLAPKQGPAWTATHGPAIASLRFGTELEPQVSVEIPALQVDGLLSAQRLLVHVRPEPGGAHGLALTAAEFNYQPAGRPPLPIAAIDFVGTLTADRQLTVHSIDLRQGSVIYKGKGSIALDGQNRLSGTLATETNDLDGLLNLLDPHLSMTGQQRAGLRAMLRLLGQNASIDIIARDGELFIGPFKVADLVPLY